MASSMSWDHRGTTGVALALSLSLATLGCVSLAPAQLAISDLSATQTVLEDGSVGVSYTMSVTNGSERDVAASELPALTVDGVAITQQVTDRAGSPVDSVGAGETVTCTGTTAFDVTADHDFALEGPSSVELSGTEAAEQVALVAEGLREDPHEMVDGAWRPCTASTHAYTISNILVQATTEYEPPRLVVRGTIENDTTNVTATKDLPCLTVDGTDYPFTIWVSGRQQDALTGRSEAEPSTADFEVALELDPTTTHTIAFTAPAGARLTGGELADEVSDYLAAFATR